VCAHLGHRTAHDWSIHPIESGDDAQTIGEGSIGPSAQRIDEAIGKVCAAQKAAYSAIGCVEDFGIRETHDYLSAVMQRRA